MSTKFTQEPAIELLGAAMPVGGTKFRNQAHDLQTFTKLQLRETIDYICIIQNEKYEELKKMKKDADHDEIRYAKLVQCQLDRCSYINMLRTQLNKLLESE